MSAIPKQTGTEVEVGFQGFVASGYVPEDGMTVIRAYSELEELSDTNGATRTKIRTNPHERWSFECVVDDASDWNISEGDILKITPPGDDNTGKTPLVAEVLSGTQATLNRRSLRLQLELIKEDSMTYTTTTSA